MIKQSQGKIIDYPRDENGRVTFANIPEVMEIPNLLAVQLESYEQFLQRDVPIDKRRNQGLESVFNSVFPIESPKGNYKLEYHGYLIGESKYSEEECKERDLTFAAPLKARLRLVINEEDEESGEVRLKDIVQSEVFLGEIPLLTRKGTFIINGAERVIVSQLHRSPGVFFGDEILSLCNYSLPWSELFRTFDEHGTGVPLLLLQKASAAVFGANELTLRLPAGEVAILLVTGASASRASDSRVDSQP